MPWFMTLIGTLLKILLAAAVGIISALFTVFCLNSPLPPWGWETNTVVAITLPSGIVLFNLIRSNISASVRIPLCVFVVIIGVVLCLLGFSDDGPTRKSLLTLSILVAAISVGGTLAINILRFGACQHTTQSKGSALTNDRISTI